MAALVLANKARANEETLGETIRAFEEAGLITHTYIPADGESVRIEYNFTPKFQALIEGI